MEDFKFSTLEYKRPDFEKTGAFAEEITEKIKNAASYGELKGYMEQMEEMSKNFSTDCTIASIRHTLDTTDEFYEKEDAYINDMVPTVMPKLLAMNDALMESKFRGDIENEYGKQYFAQMDLQKKTFCEGNIPLMQQESRLCREYEKMMATAAIPFDGKTLNLYGVQKYFEHEEREVRKAAVKAYSDFYHGNEKRLEEIWDELIKIRTQMGKNLGYENFIPVGYMQQGRTDYGMEEDENKRNKNDFVLWFTKSKFEDQALKWDSPWGVGYPGWHIECSCIGIKHLGEYMDIHCGGVDNIFPHHTNEIAQSESYLGHKWCPYWFHVNHLNDQTGKMSKSKGDFLTVSLLESKGYDPLAYRMFCLQSHYRKPLVFSYDNLDNVESAYEKLVKKIATFKDEGEMDQEAFEAFRKKFADAIRDDLNTSMALTIVYDVVKADISEKTKLALLNDFDQVLALNLTTAGQERLDAGTSVDAELEQFINEKIAERAGAKKAKDFARADAIRDELLARGITIKDTREGVVWERNA